jgi:hypothetical protein
METEIQAPKPLPFALQYGLFLGIGLIAIDYIYYALGIPYQDKVRYISFLVLLVGVIFSARYYRDKLAGGFMTYGNAFLVIFLLALFTYVLQSLNSFVMMKYLVPEMLTDIMLQTEQKLLETQPNMSDAELDAAMSMTQKMMSPGWLVIWGFVGSAFSSVLIALIAAIFVKKKDPNKLIA